MQSLTFEERTEVLDPSIAETGELIIRRLSHAVSEYLDVLFDRGDMAGVEDFCCWVHNETVLEEPE